MAHSSTTGGDASEPLAFEMAGLSVSGLWTHATDPIAVAAVAHGAGAGMTHPFMAGVAEGLASARVSVLRFNFPYMDARRRTPDAPPMLVETWQAMIQQTLSRSRGLPILVGGKSMGGRIASVLAARQTRDFPGAALVFFGYPLHAPGRTDQLRDAHLSQIRKPMLFIQGTRDRLARLDLIEAVVTRLQPLARLHVVAGGDHSFHTPGSRASDHENGRMLGQIAGEYIRGITAS